MTAHDARLANETERRGYVQAEPGRVIDAADLLAKHALIGDGNRCECDRWDWRVCTHPEHQAYALDTNGLLRDDREATRWRLLAEQVMAELAVHSGKSIATVRSEHGVTS